MQKIRHILIAIVALSVAMAVSAQEQPKNQYIVLMKHGPKWIAGKSVNEQPLLNHGKYLKTLMDKGTLQLAGPLLDDFGGFILLNAADESEARKIVEHDPGVMDQILQPEIHPIRIAFDASTGKSPFK